MCLVKVVVNSTQDILNKRQLTFQNSWVSDLPGNGELDHYTVE